MRKVRIKTRQTIASLSLGYEQSLFPLGNSRAKITRERARAKIACHVETCRACDWPLVYFRLTTLPAHHVRQAIFALARVFFLLDYP